MEVKINIWPRRTCSHGKSECKDGKKEMTFTFKIFILFLSYAIQDS